MLPLRFPVSPPLQPKFFPCYHSNNAPHRAYKLQESSSTFPFRSSNIDMKESGDHAVALASPEAAGLRHELMPKHVAVIMDGNRRWAKERGLSSEEGHRAGQLTFKRLVHLCNRWGIQVLSPFAFSTENWTRSKEEIEFLIKLLHEESEPQPNPEKESTQKYLRRSIIGSKSGLPTSLQTLMSETNERAKHEAGSHCIFAMNYGGRYDILQACKSVASKVKDGVIKLEDITENLFEEELETRITQYPNPDLLIRTGGERRLSNFMLWQLAYTELYFTDKLFPDFSDADFIEALKWFQNRQRRYGGGG